MKRLVCRLLGHRRIPGYKMVRAGGSAVIWDHSRVDYWTCERCWDLVDPPEWW